MTRSGEDGSDSAEGAAGEESPERTGDERPYRFHYSLEHLKPVDFNFHVVSFLGVVCVPQLDSAVLCGVLCACESAENAGRLLGA